MTGRCVSCVRRPLPSVSCVTQYSFVRSFVTLVLAKEFGPRAAGWFGFGDLATLASAVPGGAPTPRDSAPDPHLSRARARCRRLATSDVAPDSCKAADASEYGGRGRQLQGWRIQ